MLKKDFWYDLPKELIAQEPASPRDAARLMVLSQKDDSIQHKVFRDLPEFLEPGDLLVVNNSKVLPARIVGVKQPTGAVCELLLLRQVKGDQWECLAKPGKRMQPGTKVSFGDGSLTAVVDETMEDGNKYVTFYYDTETLYEKLDEFGKMPLPPYITKQLEDQSQYQTVYAKELGSAAAPTAGLHFTPELMDTIRAMGVGIAEVTLHVGLGTFRPVQEDEISDHKMHSEWYSVSEETAKEMAESLALDLVGKGLKTNRVALAVGYDTASLDSGRLDSCAPVELKRAAEAAAASYAGPVGADHYGRRVPKPVSGSIDLGGFTSSASTIRTAIDRLFCRLVDSRLLVRRLNVTALDVATPAALAAGKHYEQPDLFSVADEGENDDAQTGLREQGNHGEADEDSELAVQQTLLDIKRKFGKNSVIKAMDMFDGATGQQRNNQIGGHAA